MSEPIIQHDHAVITDVEIVKMMSDPMRMRIAEALTEPHTAKELAKVFDVPVTRLYYHINLMEEHGMIQVVDTKMVSGIPEKRYQLIARNFSVDGNVFSFDASPGRRVDEMARAIFDNARQQLRQLIAKRNAEGEFEATISLQQMMIALSPDEREALDAELEALIQRYDPDRAGLTPDAKLYSLTYALLPNVEAEALAQTTRELP